MAVSELLRALGLGAGTAYGMSQLHGTGLDQILSPLDWPRQALYNMVAAPIEAGKSGDNSFLMGSLPGLAGTLLGGAVGGPLGILAGSALGGGLQGLLSGTGHRAFQAPSVQDITGTEDFLPNALLGMATDPLTYAGLGSSWRGASGALKGMEGAAATAAQAPNMERRLAQIEAMRNAPNMERRLGDVASLRENLGAPSAAETVAPRPTPGVELNTGSAGGTNVHDWDIAFQDQPKPTVIDPSVIPLSMQRKAALMPDRYGPNAPLMADQLTQNLSGEGRRFINSALMRQMMGL